MRLLFQRVAAALRQGHALLVGPGGSGRFHAARAAVAAVALEQAEARAEAKAAQDMRDRGAGRSPAKAPAPTRAPSTDDFFLEPPNPVTGASVAH